MVLLNLDLNKAILRGEYSDDKKDTIFSLILENENGPLALSKMDRDGYRSIGGVEIPDIEDVKSIYLLLF